MSGKQVTPEDRRAARKARLVALVMVGTAVLWTLAQVFGPAADLPVRYALLIDFMAIAAFFWALVVTFQLWRSRD